MKQKQNQTYKQKPKKSTGRDGQTYRNKQIGNKTNKQTDRQKQ
jgi:hypothetical protein